MQKGFKLKGWWLIACVVLIWLASSSLFLIQSTAIAGELAKATFAGGCFWCMEKPFDEVEGVVATTSGYTGGTVPQPTYRQVSSGNTGHAESVEILYNPQQVSYEKLLDVFWHNIDPVDDAGQFCDRGTQYRASIFYQDETQKKLAEKSKVAIAESGKMKQPITTAIVAAKAFYPAEDYHQNYYQKNPLKYRFYRTTCGRDRRLAEVWGESTPSKY